MWKPIPGYEGLYEVSSRGEVRSARRAGTPGLIRKPRRHPKTGYLYLNLSKDNDTKTYMVHSLVALTFLGERPAGQEARHVNGDQLDNKLNNLAYGTKVENAQDTLDHGNNRNARKTHCKRDHLFDEENTYIVKTTGARRCKQCVRDYQRQTRGSRRPQ